MKNLKFIDREPELKFLEGQHKTNGSNLVIIYGRRRTGKTELINEFQKNKPHVYFLCDKRGAESNAKELARISAEHFGDVMPAVRDFYDAFLYLTKRLQSNEKLIVAIDEFSYLVEKDASIPSIFQKIVDEIIKNRRVMLILCGSSMSMMYEGTLSYKSPLYGRRTGFWELKPLEFKNVYKFFPEIGLEQAIQMYSIFGNIPAYLSVVNPKNSLEKNVIEKIMKKGAPLYREPEILLQAEIREVSTYKSILEAMSTSAKLSEIAGKAGIDAKDLPKYFKVLDNLQLIRKEIPATEVKSNKSLYFINDRLFSFWFGFCSGNMSYIEEGKDGYVFDKFVAPNLVKLFSFAFEDVAREMLAYATPFHAEKIGRWWGYERQDEIRKRIEIDSIALNEKTKQILFCECKWQNGVNAMKILAQLKEKAKFVQWNNEKRKEHYAIFAKSFKERIKAPGLMLFDLKDMEKFFKQ